MNRPTSLIDPKGLCSSAPPNGYAWDPGDTACTHKHPISCNTIGCADQYYGGTVPLMWGGKLYPGCPPVLPCPQNGTDEFDAMDSSTGAFYSTPPGGTSVAPNGEIVVSATGSLAFSDQLWTDVNFPSEFLGSNPSSLRVQELPEMTNGNYAYMMNFSAASQSPGVAPFGLILSVEDYGVFQPGFGWTLQKQNVWQWLPLPGFGQ